MEISLVTNKTLKEDNERLRMENRMLDEKNSILAADKTALANRNRNLKMVVDELLKEKEMLANRLSSLFLSGAKKEREYENKQVNL